MAPDLTKPQPAAIADPVACRVCAEELAPGSAFCSSCGVVVAAADRPSYRGPIVTALVGLVLLVLGAAVAAATFSTVSADGASGIAVDVAGPYVNDALKALGVDQVQLDPSGGGASAGVVLAFVLAVLVASVGALVLLAGGTWALVRYVPQSRRRELRVTAGPAAAAQLQRGRQQAAVRTEQYRPHVEKAVKRSAQVARDDLAPAAAKGARQGVKLAREGSRRLAERRAAKRTP